MLSYLRGKRTSKFVLAFITVVMAAFAFAGISYRSMGGFGGRAVAEDSVATVDGETLTTAQLRQDVDQVVRRAQAQNPSASAADFVASGGLEPLLAQQIQAMTLEAFGRRQGLVAGKRLVDSQIVNTPAFQVGGKFDEATFRSLLDQQRVTEGQLRRDLAGDMIRRQLLIPMVGATQIPKGVAALYASLLLETREGLVGLVPTAAMHNGTPPSDAELSAYYSKHIAHYTMPERRVLRYALIGADQVSGPPPSEADIARFYQANADSYAAVQKRKLAQIVLQDPDKAKAFVAKVKSGTSFDKAAEAEGFTPADVELGEQTRKTFADKTTGPIVDAAFSASKGALVGPIKSDFGWNVVQVEAIDDVPARPLSAVHDEIAASLAKQQKDERLADLVNGLQDSLDSASFDDVVRQRHLTAEETPPITADGNAPEQKGYVLPNVVRPLLKAAFDASEGDHPTIETIGSGQTYALLAVSRILPAAPIPLAKVHDQVASDFAHERALKRAQQVADKIVAVVEAGTSMSKAFAEASLPEPQKAGGRRGDLGQNGQRVPPALAFLFTLPRGATRSLPAGNDQGYLVVHVGKVTPGDAKSEPALIDAARIQLSGALGEEYADQFAAAAAKTVKVKRDNQTIAQLKAQLAESAPSTP